MSPCAECPGSLHHARWAQAPRLIGLGLALQALLFTAHAEPAGPQCARPPAASAISEPADLRSRNGELRVTLNISSAVDAQGHTRYCYTDAAGNVSPTLRAQPGDTLYVLLRNRMAPRADAALRAPGDPCSGGAMSAATTNLHFHGLSVPPLCHQDETLRTLVQPGETFEYRVHLSPRQPPGLYWYHPHVHGFSEQHLLGGASGAIVVEGIERWIPEAAGLPERVLVVRDEWMGDEAAARPGEAQRPSKQLSLNYVPVSYPQYRPGRLQMRPGARELWRVLNASADTYLYLYVEFSGKRQLLALLARDGVPRAAARAGGSAGELETTLVYMPPGARAEFIVRAPESAASGRLMTAYVSRGADDDTPVTRPGAPAATPADQDPTRPLAEIAVEPQAVQPARLVAVHGASASPRSAPPGDRRLPRSRTLYFSEAPSAGGGTDFFVTEEGHAPAIFDPNRRGADITVHQGDVEDWQIENRSREIHAFHIHQLHFRVVARSRQPVLEPDALDTVNIPAWRGYGPFPSVTLRMDFSDPRIVGLIPFHCHIAQHLDGGMMGTVEVLPRGRTSR